MAIVWGAYAGRTNERVGIDVWTDGYDTNTPSITVYVDIYVESQYTITDEQVLSWGGSGINGSQAISMRQGTYHITRQAIPGQGQIYAGGPIYSWSASISGHFQGVTPGVSVTWALPPRPANIPAAPPTGVDSVTASSARVVVSAADGRGAGVDAYNVRVQRQADAAIVYDQVGSGTVTVGGLARSTGHVAFSRAHNAIGWGVWSSGTGFTTSGTVPDAPTAAPVLRASEPDTLGVTWAAPVDGGSAITGYDLQASTTSAFTTAITTSTTATSGTVTGLVPATPYFVRFRAKNAFGASTWSPVLSTETLPSAKVRVAGAWQRAKVWVLAPTGWAQAKVWKRTPDGTWRL
jgi:hypothetical protein